MHFNFVANDHFDLKSLDSVENFVDSYPDFQTVWLKDEDELNLLLDLIGIHEIVGVDQENPLFSKFWDISNFKFPEFDSEQFDKFYKEWIQITKRDNSMNEYGSLVFLHGLSSKWNKLKYRLIIKEIAEGT